MRIVQEKFVKRVKEKNDTIQSWSSVIKTGADGEARAKPWRAPIPTPMEAIKQIRIGKHTLLSPPQMR